jgi:hypothetical protein
MESEIATMKYIKQNTSIPLPTVYGFDLDPTNTVGAEYMFMEALRGHLTYNLTQIPDEVKRKVYTQVVEIMLQLSRLRMPFIGLLHGADKDVHISGMIIEEYYRFKEFSTATEFYKRRASNYYDRELLEGNEDHIVVAWLYEKAIEYFVQPESDCGPFPLRHPDFNNCNILYDDDWNITGVIDWTATYSSPWEGFLTPAIEFRLPEFNTERELFFEIFEIAANATQPKLPISNFMSSKAGRIVALVNNYHFGHPPVIPDCRTTELIELMFGNHVTWADITRIAS